MATRPHCAPQGLKHLGGGNAPVSVRPAHSRAPQGLKSLFLMPLRGVGHP